MHLKLERGQLVGETWRPKGYVFPAEGKYAEAFVRSGAATPVPAPIQTAALDLDAERAVGRGPRK